MRKSYEINIYKPILNVTEKNLPFLWERNEMMQIFIMVKLTFQVISQIFEIIKLPASSWTVYYNFVFWDH